MYSQLTEMEGTWSKELRKIIDQVRMPSGQCEACLSDKSPDKDFMITCTVCQSSIHNKHYGRQIDESTANITYDQWKCERCRMLLLYEAQNKISEADNMQCNFCPNPRGILKRVIYNNNETIWVVPTLEQLHPECATWPYPIIFQRNNRRIHYNCEFPQRSTGHFWVNLDGQSQAECQICKKSQGYKIKCMYYTCQKYYHCTCAKSIGFIRDLESMRFQNSDTYIPPYCEEHLQGRIADCATKMNKYRSAGDEGKASSFNQMMASYQVQLKNMKSSALKYKNQEEIRKQMEYQIGEKEDILEDLSFNSIEESFHSNHDPSFLNSIFDYKYPSSTSSLKKRSFLFSKCSNSLPPKKERMEDEKPAEEVVMEEKEILGEGYLPLLTGKNNMEEGVESEPEESLWGSDFSDGRMSD